MSSIVNIRHININRILLLTIGLWPYQRSKLINLQMILILIILTTFVIFQLTTFITADFSLSLVINVFSSALCFLGFAINYSWFWNNLSHVKFSLEQLHHIYSEIKDVNEIAIIEKYGSSAKRLTINILVLFSCITFLYVIEPIWPCILSAFLSINKSRAHHSMLFMTEYFVDEEKYFYLILLHMNAATCIGIMIMTATGSMIIMCLQYACGFFKIASYRIKHAITNRKYNQLENVNLKGDVMIYKQIIFAVDIHRKAMQFAEYIASSFEVLFFFLIGISVICMSLNLFGIASFKKAEEFIQPLLRGSGILYCLFAANYVGQEITDHNNYIFFTVYDIQWYKAPLRIQKLILFLLQRGSKAFSLTVGGLFISSLDGFATLITASISYFTVIYSTQH